MCWQLAEERAFMVIVVVFNLLLLSIWLMFNVLIPTQSCDLIFWGQTKHNMMSSFILNCQQPCDCGIYSLARFGSHVTNLSESSSRDISLSRNKFFIILELVVHELLAK